MHTTGIICLFAVSVIDHVKGDNAASITGKKPKGTSTKAGLGYKGKGATKEIPYKEKGKVIALPKKKR